MKQILSLFLSLLISTSCTTSRMPTMSVTLPQEEEELIQSMDVVAMDSRLDTVAIHRHVAQLLFKTPDGGRLATGFAVSRTQIMTAGHFCTKVQDLALSLRKPALISIKFVNDHDEIEDDKGFRIIKIDTENDICVIGKKTGHKLMPVEIEKDFETNVKRGQRAYLIGGPLGLFPVVKEGFVASKHGTEFPFELDRIMVVSVTGYAGNSGSPVFAEDGKVIGMVTMGLPAYPDLIMLAEDANELLAVLKR